jgi:hypothetical protein
MVLTVVSAVGASGLIVPALADGASSSTFPILVMGDSYSAGNGAGDYAGPKGCWRSPNNYAGLYSQALNQPPYDQLSYVASSACSGDKTSSFFSTTNGRAPQLDSVNKHYGLILLTIGGDDVGFAGIVQNCLIAAFVNVAKCKALLSEADKLLSDGTIEGRVRRVLSGIRSRADSRAVIALLGYPYLESDAGYVIDKGAPDAFNVGGWLRRIEDKGDAIQKRLIAELDRHDHTSSFVFVKTKALFKGHELSAESSNPNRWFVEPLTNATIASRFTWYHPNPTGWAEEAKLLLSDPSIPKRDPIGTAPPHPRVTLVVSLSGSIGSLRLGASSQAEVVAAMGPPEREFTGNFENLSYPAFVGLGYECGSRPISYGWIVGAEGPPYCETFYYIDQLTGTLGAMWTTSVRYETSGETTVGMPGQVAASKERQRAVSGCGQAIFESNSETSLDLIIAGGRLTQPGEYLEGGQVSAVMVESRQQAPIGLLFC